MMRLIILDGMGEFSTQNAKKHPELIIDFLKSFDGGKYLLKTMQYTHRYPACWRCKTELVWRVTLEWYIAMDVKEKDGKTLREQMMDTAKMIQWHRSLDWKESWIGCQICMIG
jgi:isoleucyl-tRNA synthetase